MKTLAQLQNELKEQLSECTHVNDGSLAAHVNENIQWAWDNWDIDFTEHFEGDEKPENYTPSFRDEWIENEPFEPELDAINNPE